MDELDLLVEMPYEEEEFWHDSFEEALAKGMSEEKAIEYATAKMEIYFGV